MGRNSIVNDEHPTDDILEGLYKLRIRESEKLKTVLELYDLQFDQKKLGLDYHRLKTMVKRSIEQNLRMKHFEAKNGNFETSAVVKNQGTKQREQKNSRRLLAVESQLCSVLKETIAVSVTISISVQKQHSRILLRALLRGRMREMHREPEVPEASVPMEECFDCHARITSKELAPIHFVTNGILQSACSTSPRTDADLGKSALMHTVRLMNSPAKGLKKNGDKSAVAMLKKDEYHHRTGRPVVNVYSSYTRQLGCVFQDMEPPKSSSILRKSSNIRKPIRCVRFTEAVLRHANIRDQNPSLGMICPSDPHQRNPNAPNLRIGLREAAWKLAKSVLNLKEQERAAFFSPSENWCLPASNLKPEEREFVVDSGASMHMISKKDLSDAEMYTLTKSCSPYDSHNRQWRSADA